MFPAPGLFMMLQYHYSLLDTYRIRDDIWSYEKSRELLPKYRDALDVAAQVAI